MKRKKINSNKIENKILFSNKINLEINYGVLLKLFGNLHRRGIRDKRISREENNSLKEKGSGGDVKGAPPFFCFSEKFLGFLKLKKIKNIRKIFWDFKKNRKFKNIRKNFWDFLQIKKSREFLLYFFDFSILLFSSGVF